MEKPKEDKLTNAIVKWIGSNCRPISVVEEVGLRNVLK